MNRKVYERHLLSKLLIFMGVTTAIVVLFTNSISKKQAERNQMIEKDRTIAIEVERLEEENTRLHEQHNALLTDPLQIEKYAREHLDYVAPGEEQFDTINFKVKSDDTTAAKDTANATEYLMEGRFPWQIPALILLVSTIVFYVSYCFENYKIRR